MINLSDEILAGLFICSHNPDVTEEVKYGMSGSTSLLEKITMREGMDALDAGLKQ